MAQTNELMRLICPVHGSQRVPASNYQCPHGDYDQTLDTPASPSPAFIYQTTIAAPMPVSEKVRLTSVEASVSDHETRINTLENP